MEKKRRGRSSVGSMAFAQYLDAKAMPTVESKTGEHRYTPNAIDGMQKAILDVLRAGGPIPNEMRDHLTFAFEEVCAGIESDLLSPVRRSGGRERPIAKHMQAAAIRYLRWVEDGRIDDRRPTSTVAEAYGVTDSAVRGWKRAWSALPTPCLAEEFGADEVAVFMRATGKQYHRFIKKPTANPHSGRLKENR